MSIGKQSKKSLSSREFLKQAKNSKLKSKDSYKRPSKAKFLGRIYGLSLTEFLHTVYVRNEQIPPSQRMSDPKICDFIKKEYSKYKEIISLFTGVSGIRKVIFYRNYFNKGELCNKFSYPEFLSFRYDDEGSLITSDRADNIYTGAVYWKTKKSAYYTSHAINKLGEIPLELKNYFWVLDKDDAEVSKAMEQFKRYSNAAKKRHKNRKENI